ncbi:MAG: hypothetical protein J7M14_05505, partial [Planctomycetes bacterium]|nr:hypothetical protein [Planctomycetota bacterium]
MIDRIIAPALVLAAAALCAAAEKPRATRPDGDSAKVHVVVFDFAGGDRGEKLADSIRLRLRRQANWEVVDRLTTQEFSGAIAADSNGSAVVKLMKNLACEIAVFGSVERVGAEVHVRLGCIDLRGERPPAWTGTFSDSTERSRAILSRKIVEMILRESQWTPPQWGDEAEPKEFGPPVNVNGGFERGSLGWDTPDGVSTFLIKRPNKCGTILRVRTDLERDSWLAYRRALMLGEAKGPKPPRVARDVSYKSVGGTEGVHYRSGWIDAKPGQRYWLTADCKGLGGAKVFVKGFLTGWDGGVPWGGFPLTP